MCEFKESSENDNQPKESSNTISTVENGTKETTDIPKKGAVTFETALSQTKFGKFNYLLIFLAGLILANVLLETLGISFVLPVSQCDLNLTTHQKGILSAIGFAGIITSSHLWGFLADTTGRRRVIRPTLLIGFIITVLSSFVNSFWLFALLRYLNGLFVSGGSAIIYAYLGEFHTTKTRSRAIMGASFIFGIGCMLLPAIAWLVINQSWSFQIEFLGIIYRPWRLFLIVCGIPGLICGLLLFKIPESPKFMLSQGKTDETIKILQMIYSVNTGKKRTEYEVTNVVQDPDDITKQKVLNPKSNAAVTLLRSMWNQTAPLFNREFVRRTCIACTLQLGIFATSNGMYMWFPDILNKMVEFNENHPSNRTTICEVLRYKKIEAMDEPLNCTVHLEISTYKYSLILEVMYAFGFAIIGGIINTVGKIPILFLILVGCGSCGIAAVLVDTPILAIYLYVILLLCGLGVTVVNAATVDLFPTNLRAMAVCISLMLGRLGSVAGANIVGAFLDNNCEFAFYISGASLILCGFLSFLIPTPQKKLLTPTTRRDSLISMTGN